MTFFAFRGVKRHRRTFYDSINMVHPVNAYLYYYFAVIARSIEGNESDATIPGGAEKLVTAPSGRYGIASAVALQAMADRSHGLQLPPSLFELWRDRRDDKWRGMVLIQVLISRMNL
ncbi:MAG: hypothetical protein GXP52_04525 [Deltaproteobacteria bacterium]|nr:hypothetical protein [Deltaproteobacteria bacterium]